MVGSSLESTVPARWPRLIRSCRRVRSESVFAFRTRAGAGVGFGADLRNRGALQAVAQEAAGGRRKNFALFLIELERIRFSHSYPS